MSQQNNNINGCNLNILQNNSPIDATNNMPKVDILHGTPQFMSNPYFTPNENIMPRPVPVFTQPRCTILMDRGLPRAYGWQSNTTQPCMWFPTIPKLEK